MIPLSRSDRHASVCCKGKTVMPSQTLTRMRNPSHTLWQRQWQSPGGYLGTAWNKPADVSPEDLTPNWVIHTAPDNVNNGYQIAKALLNRWAAPARSLRSRDCSGNTSNTDRYAGLQKALEEYPDIEVVYDDTANLEHRRSSGSC